MGRKAVWPLFWFTVLMLVIPFAGTLAQARSVEWRRWDVVIDEIDAVANRFHVSERYAVGFTGVFQTGARVIPYHNLETITDIRVSQDGQPLTEACSEAPGTYCVEANDDEISIRYTFLSPIDTGDAVFQVDYTVTGALRVYEDGDQVWWSAVPPDHFGIGIGGSTVTVELPEGYAPREGVDPVESYGVPAGVTVNGTTVVFEASRPLDSDDYLEVRVQFPHHEAAVAPFWQAAADQPAELDALVQPPGVFDRLVLWLLRVLASI